MFASPRWDLALFFLVPALMAVNYVLGRLALGLVAPHMLALLRWALAGLILLVFAWPELHRKKRWCAAKSGTAWCLGCWVCGFAGLGCT